VAPLFFPVLWPLPTTNALFIFGTHPEAGMFFSPSPPFFLVLLQQGHREHNDPVISLTSREYPPFPLPPSFFLPVGPQTFSAADNGILSARSGLSPFVVIYFFYYFSWARTTSTKSPLKTAVASTPSSPSRSFSLRIEKTRYGGRVGGGLNIFFLFFGDGLHS